MEMYSCEFERQLKSLDLPPPHCSTNVGPIFNSKALLDNQELITTVSCGWLMRAAAVLVSVCFFPGGILSHKNSSDSEELGKEKVTSFPNTSAYCSHN